MLPMCRCDGKMYFISRRALPGFDRFMFLLPPSSQPFTLYDVSGALIMSIFILQSICCIQGRMFSNSNLQATDMLRSTGWHHSPLLWSLPVDHITHLFHKATSNQHQHCISMHSVALATSNLIAYSFIIINLFNMITLIGIIRKEESAHMGALTVV